LRSCVALELLAEGGLRAACRRQLRCGGAGCHEQQQAENCEAQRDPSQRPGK
jgi:hypothetical protein